MGQRVRVHSKKKIKNKLAINSELREISSEGRSNCQSSPATLPANELRRAPLTFSNGEPPTRFVCSVQR